MNQRRRPSDVAAEPASRGREDRQRRQHPERREHKLPGERPPKPIPVQHHSEQQVHLGQKRKAGVDVMRQPMDRPGLKPLLRASEVILLHIEIDLRQHRPQRHREHKQAHRDDGDRPTNDVVRNLPAHQHVEPRQLRAHLLFGLRGLLSRLRARARSCHSNDIRDRQQQRQSDARPEHRRRHHPRHALRQESAAQHDQRHSRQSNADREDIVFEPRQSEVIEGGRGSCRAVCARPLNPPHDQMPEPPSTSQNPASDQQERQPLSEELPARRRFGRGDEAEIKDVRQFDPNVGPAARRIAIGQYELKKDRPKEHDPANGEAHFPSAISRCSQSRFHRENSRACESQQRQGTRRTTKDWRRESLIALRTNIGSRSECLALA